MSSKSLRERLVDLVPVLRGRRDAAEKARQIPAETISELRDVGLFRAFVPRKYGGDEQSLYEVLDGMTELGRGCTSSAWVGSLLSVHNLAVAWSDKRAQEEMFAAGPDLVLVSSVAPTGKLTRVEGGYRLNGRWSFVSGADHGAWAMLGGVLREEPGGPAPYFLLFVPASDYVIHDDWDVAGLRATGSKSIELKDVFVPEYRALSMKALDDGSAPGLAVNAGALYRLPWLPVFISAFPPAALGTALANIEDFRSYTATRAHAMYGTELSSNPGHLCRLADATAQLESLRALFRHNLEEIERSGGASRDERERLRVRINYNCGFAVDGCSHAIERLFRGSGGKALHAKNPLQRYFRDIHAITQHASFDMDVIGPMYGAALIDED